ADDVPIASHRNALDSVLLQELDDIHYGSILGHRYDGSRHDVADRARPRFRIFFRQHVLIREQSQPPGSMFFGADLVTAHQVAFTHNADQPAVEIDDGHRADTAFQHELRRLA